VEKVVLKKGGAASASVSAALELWKALEACETLDIRALRRDMTAHGHHGALDVYFGGVLVF
jgi:hypothetical protein